MRDTAEMRPFKWILPAALILLTPSISVIADQTGDVEALEAQCEQQREARIKPLRDMEIAKCKADSDNDPGYCERYWKDYGNAMRKTKGGVIPRMFDDLPVCIAAFEARKALINKAGA
jgi:hypothetical protein